MGLDVGPESVAQFVAVVEKSATIVWNGSVRLLSRADHFCGIQIY